MTLKQIQIIKIEQIEDYHCKNGHGIYHRYNLHRDDGRKPFGIGVDTWYCDLDNRFHQIDREMEPLISNLESGYATISNYYETTKNLKEIERERYEQNNSYNMHK